MSAARLSISKHVSIEVEIEAEDVLRAVGDDALQAECVRRGIVPDHEVPAVTGEHIRGARGLLGWSLARLAAESRVSISTIKRFEDGTEGQTRPGKVEALRCALQRDGVQFRSIAGTTCILRTLQATTRSDAARVSA